MSTLPKHVTLKKNEDRRLLGGHQWVFSNEILTAGGAPQPGDLVELLRSDGRPLGCGFYNAHSLIAVRLLSSSIVEPDRAFFRERIDAARRMRERLFPGATAYRVVHGESDFLPGLVVDRFNDVIAVQTYSAGMDRRLPEICDVLEELFAPKGIVERNESPLRDLEHLSSRKGILRGAAEPQEFDLNGVRFRADILSGQKSGFFLDQRQNRTLLSAVAGGASVLDCFCNEGGFGLYAARYGARSVESVDISADALERASANAALNGLTTLAFTAADVFAYLADAVKEGRKWDVVVLDPPSFTKSRKTLPAALKGYREINTNALRLVEKGGFLLTASCSHHVDRDTFVELVGESAVKAGRKLRLLSVTGASPDHPELPAMPETRYLKCVFCQVE